MNLEGELARLKGQLQNARTLKDRAEGQLQALDQEKKAILAEMAALGVTPEQLDGEVARLEEEIANLLGQARALIPRELLAGPGQGSSR
ncbi:MAG: hypothetical protein AB1816_08335 [Bacillota bacterium]|nr:hypothetical protein [Bacillota bacterium]